MIVLGVTGGIASGKTTLCHDLKEILHGLKDRKLAVIDADKLGHRAYEKDTPCYYSIVEHFGKAVVADDGEINRKALGGIVFGAPEKMRELEAIVWPVIYGMLEAHIAELRDKEDEKLPTVCVLEAAVMHEAEWSGLCDVVWTTMADPAIACERLMKRNNLTVEEADKRINSQMTNEARRELVRDTDIIITNNGTEAQFKADVATKFASVHTSSVFTMEFGGRED